MIVANSPINKEKLREIMGDDEELLKECLMDFINDYPGMLHKIRSAIDTQKCNDLERAAHAFKGSLTYLAAQDATHAAFELETMGKNKNLKHVDTMFARLKTECERIRAFASSY